MSITTLLWDLYHFSRFSALGATAALPLLGAGSVSAQLTPRRATGLLAVASAFHLFAYLHNDICDLDLDRTQPRRRHYPLVRGAVQPELALGLALICVPLAFALHTRLVAGARRRSTTAGARPAPSRPSPTWCRPWGGPRCCATGRWRRAGRQPR
jgi:hypothetical protein